MPPATSGVGRQLFCRFGRFCRSTPEHPTPGLLSLQSLLSQLCCGLYACSPSVSLWQTESGRVLALCSSLCCCQSTPLSPCSPPRRLQLPCVPTSSTCPPQALPSLLHTCDISDESDQSKLIVPPTSPSASRRSVRSLGGLSPAAAARLAQN